jgi:hypothetical protein
MIQPQLLNTATACEESEKRLTSGNFIVRTFGVKLDPKSSDAAILALFYGALYRTGEKNRLSCFRLSCYTIFSYESGSGMIEKVGRERTIIRENGKVTTIREAESIVIRKTKRRTKKRRLLFWRFIRSRQLSGSKGASARTQKIQDIVSISAYGRNRKRVPLTFPALLISFLRALGF